MGTRARTGKAVGAGAVLEGLGREREGGSRSIPCERGLPGGGFPGSERPEASRSAPSRSMGWPARTCPWLTPRSSSSGQRGP